MYTYLFHLPFRVIVSLILLLGIFPGLHLQSGHYRPDDISADGMMAGRVIFRLKAEVAAYGKSDGVEHVLFHQAMGALKPMSVGKVFPHHQSPAGKTHPTGEKMADISLIYELRVAPERCPQEVIDILLRTGLVEYAEPRYIPALLFELDDDLPATFVPNDSLLHRLYYLDNIRAYEAWAVARGDTSVFVAIVDTGNDFYHPDLHGSLSLNYGDPVNGEDSDGDGYIDNFYGWDLGEDNNYPQYNRHGHGVHVSGTSSATADNRLGIAGTGFHSRYLPVKVDDAFGRLVMAYEGIVYAADRGASVINCSWGSHFGGGRFGEDIVRYATLNRDALVVAGAGNAASSLPFYPASYEHVLGVAATDSLDRLWDRSSYGLFTGLTAPGVRILSTWPDTMYITSSGTSMSSPVVAGAAAIVRGHFPELSALQVAARLKATADLIDTIAANSDYAGLLGAGRLNMYRALTDPFTPYMRLAAHRHDEEGYGTYRAGNTMPVTLDFQNLLAPATQIKAVLTSLSPHVSMVNDTSELGPVATLETVHNAGNPFMVNIGSDVPLNHTVPFFVDFYEQDSLPAGRQGFMIVVNRDYLTIDAGRIQTTVTSKGAIGFNYPNYAQGVGLLANRGFTTIKCAGLVFGSHEDRVSDNIYGPAGTYFSQSFIPLTNVSYDPAPLFGDVEVSGRFNDRGAGERTMGIVTDFRSYFWKEAPRNQFFITEYLLTNALSRAPRHLHTGFFVDWHARNSISMQARYEEGLNLAFVNTDDGRYAALQMLTGEPVNHYAFDNDGNNGSIKINQGFEMAGKYLAMTSQRDEAGSFRPENDVSSMLSTGPHYLPQRQSTKVAIALHVADNLEDLMSNAREALGIYDNIQAGSVVPVTDPSVETRTCPVVFPNPFSAQLTIQVCRTTNKKPVFSLYNSQGHLVYRMTPETGADIQHQYVIGSSHLPPGAYFLLVEHDDGMFPFKLIKFE